MSQLQDSPGPTTVSGDVQNQNDENLVALLENLTVFITASSKLVQSLQQTIEASKKSQSIKQDEEENTNTCICPSCPNMKGLGEGAASANVTNTLNVRPIAGISGPTLPTNTGVEQGFSKAPGDGMMLEDLTLHMSATDSTKREDCSCKTQTSMSKGSIKSTKSKTKSKSLKKQSAESFSKEKSEKLTKLKNDLNATQKNLSDIQEQVRQLERLYQDYETINTSEGQVNPAALYKQIMKPQSVPYVSPSQASKKSGCPGGCSSLTGAEVTFRNQSYGKKPQEKVSILSAVPLDQAYL